MSFATEMVPPAAKRPASSPVKVTSEVEPGFFAALENDTKKFYQGEACIQRRCRFSFHFSLDAGVTPAARGLFHRVVAKRCAAQIFASSHRGCRGRSPCRTPRR